MVKLRGRVGTICAVGWGKEVGLWRSCGGDWLILDRTAVMFVGWNGGILLILLSLGCVRVGCVS